MIRRDSFTGNGAETNESGAETYMLFSVTLDFPRILKISLKVFAWKPLLAVVRGFHALYYTDSAGGSWQNTYRLKTEGEV